MKYDLFLMGLEILKFYDENYKQREILLLEEIIWFHLDEQMVELSYQTGLM